jgi:hypothetical protein
MNNELLDKINELRNAVMNGHNYASADATNEDLDKSNRDFQSGRASAFLQVLGHLNKIVRENEDRTINRLMENI